MRDTERGRERKAETQAEGEAGSCREWDVGLDPGSPGSGPGQKAGTKLLSHPGCPLTPDLKELIGSCYLREPHS